MTAAISPVRTSALAAACIPTRTLFLAAGGDLVFNDKISAFQQIIMDQLENGHSTTVGYGGTVYVPKASSRLPAEHVPAHGSELRRPSWRRNDSRRRQLERRISLAWRRSQHQFPQSFFRNLERVH